MKMQSYFPDRVLQFPAHVGISKQSRGRLLEVGVESPYSIDIFQLNTHIISLTPCIQLCLAASGPQILFLPFQKINIVSFLY